MSVHIDSPMRANPEFCNIPLSFSFDLPALRVLRRERGGGGGEWGCTPQIGGPQRAQFQRVAAAYSWIGDARGGDPSRLTRASRARHSRNATLFSAACTATGREKKQCLKQHSDPPTSEDTD